MFYHSKRHATICLDELHAPVIETGIATSDNDHIVKYPEVKAQFINSTSAMSVNGEDTCISIFATDEYVPVSNSEEIAGEST